MHYRPLLLPSAIFKRAPEIIADIPRRIEPTCPIPVFILVKDANKYPVDLEAVVIHITYPDGNERIARFPYHHLHIDIPIWWDSINIMPEQSGLLLLDVYIEISRNKRASLIKIDNYRNTSHEPLTVYVANAPLPGGKNWYHGDMHCHSYFTEDQIEFGAPLEILTFAAYCMGMQWMAVTDHSYDLDNRTESYTEQDPLLLKWRLLRKKAEMLADSFIVIPGEEVTCRTQNGKNCHMLSIGSNKFIFGSGDSGERGLKTDTEKSVSEAVTQCVEWGGLACAAHPFERVSLVERLLLNRGQWNSADLDVPGLAGMQFYNGVRDEGFRAGMRTWIQLLLAGKRMHVYGGSDAHGDLNRKRGIGIPMISVIESSNHTFGSVRTIVYAAKQDMKHIMKGLHAGHVIVTNGPFINLSAYTETEKYIPGDVCKDNFIQVSVKFHSTEEFGSFIRCRLLGGDKTERREMILAQGDPLNPVMQFNYRESIDTSSLLYIRAECETAQGNICYTNPIWIA